MSRFLKVLLLTPGALPEISGNALTAERWRRNLTSLGHSVRVFASAAADPAGIAAAVAGFRPDLLHAHHAFTSGRLALESTGWGQLPTSPNR